MLSKIDQILTRAEKIFRKNYDEQNDTVALKALSEQRNTIELLAKISYSLHQTRIAEIELAKEQSGQADYETQQEFQEQLKILSDEEFIVYTNISNKLQKQDAKINIFDIGEQTMKLTIGEQEFDFKYGMTKWDLESSKNFAVSQPEEESKPYVQPAIESRLKRSKSPNKQNLAASEETETIKNDEMPRVKPISVPEIPYTKWKDHPLNWRRRG